VIKEEQRIPVNLPIESARPQAKPDPNERQESITIQPDGRVLLNEQPYSIKQLSQELAKFAAEPKPPVIHLRMDAKATAQHIVTVMDELQKYNLTKIAFDTKTP
jgi:biopolymer transport protein ExbD